MTELEMYLNNWLADRGYELEVRECDDEFFYSDPLSLIGVAISGKTVDRHFLRFIEENGCNFEFSNAFIPCFLHELGHHETEDDFDDEDHEEYCTFNMTFEGVDMDNYENQLRYMTHPIEFAATSWAIDYINSHEDEIYELAENLNRIFNEREAVA